MNSEINEIKVNGIDYVRKDAFREKEYDGDIKICILQRGWVMVGRLERNGDACKLHNANVVRVWGTTNGLGEIAKGGPTPSTKLDKTHGVVEFNDATMIACIACEESKWKNKL